ncbi:MAG: hypothetical protein PUQ00_30915 [Nostoc sp. S13]|nr:hypothetical protein [Nostoc sp. S13]
MAKVLLLVNRTVLSCEYYGLPISLLQYWLRLLPQFSPVEKERSPYFYRFIQSSPPAN